MSFEAKKLSLKAKVVPLINDENGLINIDFSDVKTIMNEAGTTAMMGVGLSSGIDTPEERALDAVQKSLVCPLLGNSHLDIPAFIRMESK